MTYLNFMYITYSSLSCKFSTSFLIFSVFIFSGEINKLLRILRKFPGYYTSASIKYPKIFWLWVLIMSHTCLRLNLHSVVAWMSNNSMFTTGAISEV